MFCGGKFGEISLIHQLNKSKLTVIMYGKTSMGENFHGSLAFLLNCKSFPSNYGLLSHKCKSIEMLQQNFYRK